MSEGRGAQLSLFVMAFVFSACRSEEYRAVEAFCEAFEECQPENFSEEYDDTKECIDDTLDALDQAEEENGPECSDAFGTAIQCAADVNADTCDFQTVVSECRDEVVTALEKCPEIDLDSIDLGVL